MLLGLVDSIPVGHFVPWTFLFATALLATGVDAFARRPFNPVVLCVWFFGLAFSGAVGGWGVVELAAGTICLATPHMLVCTFSGRVKAARMTEDTADPCREGHEHQPPIPMSRPDEPETGGDLRRVA